MGLSRLAYKRADRSSSMSAFARLAICAALTLATALPARGEIPTDPTELAEAYFDETERFDALTTYESRRGPLHLLFSLSRRWRDGLAELLFDVREPQAYGHFALLARQTRAGSDDLFAYLGEYTDRKVRRLSAPDLEREAIFNLFALGDFRPFALGELRYEAAPDASVAGTPCRVVVGWPTTGDTLGFDRIEFAFAADTGLLLESRFFRGQREFRRITIAPEDYAEHDGRRLPMRRTAHSWGDAGQTELVMKSVLPTPDLPDELFSHRNLLVQRFPEF